MKPRAVVGYALCFGFSIGGFIGWDEAKFMLMGVDLYRGQEVTPDLIPKVRLEIAVNDDFVKPTVDAILKGARSNGGGKIGDGKIFVLPLENCIRIRTGKEGGEAI